MNFIVKLAINVAAIIGLSYLLPLAGIGISVESTVDAIKLALVLVILNTFVKPILKFFSFPITCMTMGLFSLVISAAIIKLADYFLVGFNTFGTLNGWLAALVFGLSFSFISTTVEKLILSED
jgi:putative membrane protein